MSVWDNYCVPRNSMYWFTDTQQVNIEGRKEGNKWVREREGEGEWESEG